MNGKHALIIGNTKYNDRLLKGLRAPEYDVTDLARLLADPRIGGFNVQAIINRTCSEIRTAISRFLRRSPEELALLYFSGHGIKKDGQVYLAVRDTEYEEPSALGIDANFVRGKMENCYAKRKILILDCCYSGAFARSGTKGPVEVDTKSEFLGGVGQIILTATDGLTVASEARQAIGNSKYSLFTHYLIDGLKSGRADGADGTAADGLINDNELYKYAYNNVIRAKQQTPKRLYEGGGDPIVIARNPKFKSSNGAAKGNGESGEIGLQPPRSPVHRRVPVAPQLLAEFDLTGKGRPRMIEESYWIRLFIKNAPKGTRKVVYKLDKSIAKPTREVEGEADGFEEYLPTSGDFEVVATLYGRRKKKLKRWLSRALERAYQRRANEVIADAIDEIADN